MKKACRGFALVAFGLLLAVPHGVSANGCRHAVYQVEGNLPFLEEEVGPLSIRVHGTRIALDPICSTRRARLRKTPRGTSLAVRWKDCEGIAQGVRLRLQTTSDCSRARGAIRVGSPRGKLRFRALQEIETPRPRRRQLRRNSQSQVGPAQGTSELPLFAIHAEEVPPAPSPENGWPSAAPPAAPAPQESEEAVSKAPANR